MDTTTKLAYIKTNEPLTNQWIERREWVEDQGHRTAQAYQSYLSNNTSNNTLHKMQMPENFTLADADGGGTIDKAEFGALVAAAGEGGKDMMDLFTEMDVDGDGELTSDEIKALQERKRQAHSKEDAMNWATQRK